MKNKNIAILQEASIPKIISAKEKQIAKIKQKSFKPILKGNLL